ncbi:hypothetical protein HMPREF9442_01380 [Paraprevotella xylaniphila YIT 11841]|uniref:Uncharacterized protein n=1 Tax=Paraprevotella xylaniphila YIT 11841 TaxID=762982 RepID=F3QT64_9BACT|nr:hypothetical protein HMPREF9442_01380 [Paraprevotella xylaniphila YIT 11841]
MLFVSTLMLFSSKTKQIDRMGSIKTEIIYLCFKKQHKPPNLSQESL